MTKPKNELHHKYGSNIFIFDNPFYNGLLAELCSEQTLQPRINRLVESLYRYLLSNCISDQFATEKFKTKTRMWEIHPTVFLEGQRINPQQKVISVNIARAGTYPSHICYDFLHDIIEPSCLRQDHIFASRAVNSKDQVTGTEISSTKIGGGKDDSIVLFPDPMGATGNTLIAAMKHYKQLVPGAHSKMIALHLIVTPEYLKNLTQAHPDVIIYALRLDRGLSPEAALSAVPGTHWDLEKGLNPKDYIVPGGGGFGEIMNNSFV